MTTNECPNHRPPNLPAALTGTATVTSASNSAVFFTVNFDTGVCDCQRGAAWWWNNREWKPNQFCAHKMKALASFVSKTGDLRDFYDEQLGKRYNAFIAISAFHKELRRGDVDKAMYWATVMVAHRGKHGIVAYMLNILFEETRDLSLGRYLLKLRSKGKSVTLLEMQRAVARFCAAPKKWELPWRLDLFLDEMRGYRELAETYGYEIAKGRDIVEAKAVRFLRKQMLDGFEAGGRKQLQIGVKGWFKSKSPDHDDMKIEIFNTLTDVLNGEHPNLFDFDSDYAHALHTFLLKRLRTTGVLGYHELNAMADALSGEPGADPAATLPIEAHKRFVLSPTLKRVTLGDLRQIPLYANDNHTWPGKALMRTYAQTQLRPGAEQTNIDFRYWGAYGGVAWRYLAYKQHSTIHCKWGDVKWNRAPWLWKHVESMNY